MAACAITIGALFAAPLTMRLAPDQPAPIVYMDEPLIIEVAADEDGAAALALEIRSVQGVELREELDTAHLTAHHPRWIEVNDLPLRRGPYTAEISWRFNADKGVWRQTFCRIERPGPTRQTPWAVAVDTLDPPTCALLTGIPASEVWLPATAPDLGAQSQMAATNGLRLIATASVPATSSDDATSAISSHTTPRSVDGWALHAGAAPRETATLAAALNGPGTRAPVTLVVESPSELEALLAAGVGQHTSGAAVRFTPGAAMNLTPFQSVFTGFGYEHTAFLLDFTGHETAAVTQPETVCRAVLEAWGAARTRSVIPSRALWSGNAVHPLYAYLNAMNALLADATWVGERPLDAGRALVFRKGESWIIAAWSASESAEPELILEGEHSPLVYDAFHNLIAPPLAEDGVFRFSLSARPLYLIGSGGSILREAAAWSVAHEAARFLEDELAIENISPALTGVLSALARGDTPDKDRERFFTLLRSIPALEEQWHAGTLPPATAARAIAGISRVARAMGTLDQEEGEVFIDPLVDTLGRCSDFQSDYITGQAAGASNERGDVLLHIINKLVEEAKGLSAGGRLIEGQAVAAIAEWRARSLAATAKAAPLSRPQAQPAHTPDSQTDTEPKGKKQ